jgi:hypothetical protein
LWKNIGKVLFLEQQNMNIQSQWSITETRK